MGIKKRKDVNGNEYEYVTYDRGQKATFNSYSEKELTAYRTLMNQVGGCHPVAYELYKMDNGYKETRRVIVTFITIRAKVYGDKTMILTPEEFTMEKWKYENDEKNKGKEFEYEELARDSRRQTIADFFNRNPYLVIRYKARVNHALAWNKVGNENTKKVALILAKLARMKDNRKKKQFLTVDKWLMAKEDIPQDYESIQIAKDFIDNIKAAKEERD